MKLNVIATLMTIGLAASSCGKLTVQVKKEAKNSELQSNRSAAQSTDTTDLSLNAAEDFLKSLDDLRTNAASIVIKQLASQDYVGKFRGSLRKYRTFLLEKSKQEAVLSDDFYTNKSLDCRKAGLSLNIDKDNEVLGMILQTALIAKLSETNVGNLNSSLTKELQSLSQFLSMELGVEIKGVSSADKSNDIDTSKSQVTIRLLPVAGEAIDDIVKETDANTLMSLNFERKLGKEQIGTFHAELSLENSKSVPAVAVFDVSRNKENGKFIHIASVNMGTKDQPNKYARQIIVSELEAQKGKFYFTDILNSGKNSEISQKTIIDIKEGTQCKVVGSDQPKTEEPAKNPVDPTPVVTPPTPTSPSTPTQSPSKSPTQSPTQSPT